MSKNSDIWSLISSLWNNNITQEGEQQLKEWLDKDEKHRSFFKRLSESAYSDEIEKSAQEAKERVYLQAQTKIHQIAFNRKIRLWKYTAVASIALLIVAGTFSLFKTAPADLPVLAETRSLVGTTTKLTLDDGSTVELNASSSLTYPLKFQQKSRNVTLNGEAYFEIAKDAKRPFIVEVNNMNIEVLGTQFNVRSYDDDQKAITTLVEGSVRINFNHPDFTLSTPVVLKPNQQVIFDKTTNNIEIKQVKADLYASWKEGQCFFENEQLSDILKVLERQFGITITLSSPQLGNQTFSGFFSQQEGIIQILDSFKKNRNIDYRKTKSGIEIYER